MAKRPCILFLCRPIIDQSNKAYNTLHFVLDNTLPHARWSEFRSLSAGLRGSPGVGVGVLAACPPLATRGEQQKQQHNGEEPSPPGPLLPPSLSPPLRLRIVQPAIGGWKSGRERRAEWMGGLFFSVGRKGVIFDRERSQRSRITQ